jgi:hypothetical protein
MFVVAVLSVQAQADTVSFADGTFNDSDWEVAIFEHGNGGVVTAAQSASGGNGGAFRRVHQTVNPVPPDDTSWIIVFHRRAGAIYDPGSQGAIERIDFLIDYENLTECPIGGHGQAFGPAMRQDGEVYTRHSISGTPTSWNTLAAPGLGESDFGMVDPLSPTGGDPTRHPDFSSSGATIEFGFYTSNGTHGGGFTRCVGYDNWSLTINSTCVEPPPSLVSWWPGEGSAEDIQGSNDGTLNNGAAFASGVEGQCFSLDGVDDFVDVPYSEDFDLTTDITVDAWIKLLRTPSSAELDVIVGRPYGYQLNTDARGGVLFGFPVVGVPGVSRKVTSVSMIYPNRWTHVAATYSSETGLARIYVNGALDNTVVTSGVMPAMNKPLQIGGFCDPGFTGAFLEGYIDEVEIFDRALSQIEIQAIFHAGSAGKCKFPQVGAVSGNVLAECPVPGTGLLGVEADAYELGSGYLARSCITGEDGGYLLDSLPAGDYTITVVTPLGYATSAEEIPVTVLGGQTSIVDFSLMCLEVTSDPRATGFWKHNVGVATGGRGRAHINGADLCGYLDLIESHFNSNEINQVVVYVPPGSGACEDKLLVAQDLLNLKGNVGMTARARQHLMALLLNVAAGWMHLADVVSEDGATVSQAITYCDQLIDDDEPENDEIAKDIAEMVNKSMMVPAGMIPLETPDISYSIHSVKASKVSYLSQNQPNPFGGLTGIRFYLAEPSRVTLEIYGVDGGLVKILLDEVRPAGQHWQVWDGEDESGRPVGQGIYFVRMQAGQFRDTMKMMILR